MTARARLRLTAALVALGAWSAARPASAEPDAGACVQERQEVSQLRRALDVRATEQRQAAERSARIEADRDQLEHRNGEISASLQTCQEGRARTCGEMGALADAVLAAGKVSSVPPVPGCVSPAQQTALGQLTDGYASAASLLSDLISYASGATDVPPQPRAPNSITLRTLVDHLAGGGKGPPALLLRRLLVEAVERIAPRFWRRVEAAGRPAVEDWFSSAGPLDEGLVAEAHAGTAIERASSRSDETPALVSALRLVHSYRELAGCDRRSGGARDCGRARQLQALLESSGPLVVRQRIHEIWAVSCVQIGKEEVLRWVREFPVARGELGKSDWRDIESASRAKLFSCYLADEEALGPRARAGMRPFATWFGDRLPGPDALTSRAFDRIDEMKANWPGAKLEDVCARAVDGAARLEGSVSCGLSPRVQRALMDWFSVHGPADHEVGSFELQTCARVAEALWRGRRPHVATSLNRVPSVDELVSILPNAAAGAAELRAACDKRVGEDDAFAERFPSIVRVAQTAGEDVTKSPWRADARTQEPIEAKQLRAALTLRGWLGRLLGHASSCRALGLDEGRCRSCRGPDHAGAYDCRLLDRLRTRWSRWTERLLSVLAGLAVSAALLLWLASLRRAMRMFGGWNARVREYLGGIGMRPSRDWLRWVFPSRLQALTVPLPAGPAWRQWGRRASVVAVSSPGQIIERDVLRAAARARAAGAEIALLLHEEGASPDLKSVRALLDWAAKGQGRALQILPLATERLKWARTPEDLLDIVEQISLRGNPFDVRGRLVSSSQFFDRERLVSGLLAAAQAGQWVMITGLRRFGKSSLALEAVRRLTGPSAYVDLAGFHYEIASEDPAVAAAAVLRYALAQLHHSARDRYGAEARIPEPPPTGDGLDAGALLVWLRLFVAACRAADGDRTPSFLLVFDEVEQAIGVGPTRIAHAVDVMSVLVGRLRACLLESLSPSGSRFGVVFCSAIHPVLWAPLATLGQQSFMGAFQSVFVPRLPDDAATAMMRGLGARQGIRFTDAALELIIRETAGIPILARRVGSSVLELYDPERARQGGLGAVEIGVEGAAAAVQREEEPGAPLRVWVESEIGDLHNPAGVILRRVAAAGRVSARDLQALAFAVTRDQLSASGVAALIEPHELERRSLEAAGFVLRMLAEIGMLIPEGDLSAPEAMSFPDSIVKRILANDPSRSGFGF